MISSIETGQFNPTAKLALILCITYQDAPFHDPNWQLVIVKNSFFGLMKGTGSFVSM